MRIVFPHDTAYDDDGDGLSDFRVRVGDVGGQVDVARIELRSLDGVVDPAGRVTDSLELLSKWSVPERSDSLLVVHETVEYLLQSGVNRVEVVVPDTAGNVTRDTVEFTLPPGALHKTVKTGLTMGFLPAIGLAFCPDDQRVYMTMSDRMAVFDGNDLSLLKIVFPEGLVAPTTMTFPLCVASDPVLYATDVRIQRLDRVNLTWLPGIDDSFTSAGIVQSRADPDLLYVGENYSGVIGVISRASLTRVRRLLDFAPFEEWVFGLAVLAGDTKLYATRVYEQGILVIDPQRDSILTRIRIGGEFWPGYGRADAIVLSQDDRWLYAAVLDGEPRSIVQIDTQLDSVVRYLSLANYVPVDLALSPDETRMFVTTQDRFPDLPSKNVLIDVPGWRILREFPRPHEVGQTRFDRDIVFHPNGKLIFVTHDVDLDVYLNRR